MVIRRALPLSTPPPGDVQRAAPGAPGRGKSARHPHGVQNHLLVAEGTLELKINDELVVLHAGDSILFRAERPHRYRNPHNSEAVAYLLTSPAQVQE